MDAVGVQLYEDQLVAVGLAVEDQVELGINRRTREGPARERGGAGVRSDAEGGGARGERHLLAPHHRDRIVAIDDERLHARRPKVGQVHQIVRPPVGAPPQRRRAVGVAREVVHLVAAHVDPHAARAAVEVARLAVLPSRAVGIDRLPLGRRLQVEVDKVLLAGHVGLRECHCGAEFDVASAVLDVHLQVVERQIVAALAAHGLAERDVDADAARAPLPHAALPLSRRRATRRSPDG